MYRETEPENMKDGLEEIIRKLDFLIEATPIMRECANSAPADPLAVAKCIYGGRRKRAAFFKQDLFGEAAWDMLLDLYVSEHSGRRVSVTSATLASAAASTTALRWLAILEAEGLVLRQNDPKDGRRSFLMLTEQAKAQMEEYLRAVAATF
ncbi:DNA-binding MarR family transcriptional regulator [Novosphingobium sp. PhB165]|uniref:hypothetical protein n=1 Tax=Novosphingobium sp. PhB165 TaxID=2485105 RepID=UPI00104E3FB6|nr:hypothetical protein [Novosphingobium sp. PhB165]TCM20657.1 DNA-binding MarR family transcriptional regulator [Novosphingobium sp. PhB165]